MIDFNRLISLNDSTLELVTLHCVPRERERVGEREQPVMYVLVCVCVLMRVLLHFWC